MMKNRIKSPVLWLSIIALAGFITKKWAGYEIPHLDEFAELFIAVLIAFGIVNNPTDRENF